jgi:hypothetical protein
MRSLHSKIVRQMNSPGATAQQTLRDIPVIDAPEGPLQLAEICATQLLHIVGQVQRLIPSPILRLGDAYAGRCLRGAGNPYLHEIDSIARLMGRPGAYALNFCFEMACTTACCSKDGRSAMQLYRTLDWPFRLGADIVVAKHAGTVGSYYNITWPGYVGVLTAIAHGRFAGAINQPPMTYSLDRFGLGMPVDWMINRWRMRVMTALPPAHLLRQAFEQCSTYAEAKRLLTATPICIPAIFTLTGVTPDQGCIIERRENDSVVHEGPACITNHWLNGRFKGYPRRGRNSLRRLSAMRATMATLDSGFDWLRPPVLNSLTRMAAELNAGTGRLMVTGWHGAVPQTHPLTLDR